MRGAARAVSGSVRVACSSAQCSGCRSPGGCLLFLSRAPLFFFASVARTFLSGGGKRKWRRGRMLLAGSVHLLPNRAISWHANPIRQGRGGGDPTRPNPGRPKPTRATRRGPRSTRGAHAEGTVVHSSLRHDRVPAAAASASRTGRAERRADPSRAVVRGDERQPSTRSSAAQVALATSRRARTTSPTSTLVATTRSRSRYPYTGSWPHACRAHAAALRR